MKASLTNVFVAQSVAGGDTGVNCANAHAATFFNTAGNWGAGAAQIGAGTTVHLCGTWTGAAGSTLLTFQGDGAVGNVVKVLFEPGALLQAPYFNGAASGSGGAINIHGHSNALIDGGATCGEVNMVPVPIAQCNGIIQNTANGTQLANHQTSYAIYSDGSPHNVEIRNLVIRNMYVRVDPNSDTAPPDGEGVFSIFFQNADFSGLNVHHNNIQNAGREIVITSGSINPTGVTVANNYLADGVWHLNIAGPASPGTSIGNIQVHDNEDTGWCNWRTPRNSFHQNGMIFFNGCSAGNCSVGDTSSNIFNNYVHGDFSCGGLVHSPSGGISPQDNSTGFRIFNNRVACVACEGGIYWLGCSFPNASCGGGGLIANNTVTNPGQVGNCISVDTVTPNTIENNVLSNCNALVFLTNHYTQAAVSNFNDGFIGSNVWAEGQTPFESFTLAQWRAAQQKDLNSVTGDPLLDGNDRLQAGSAAIGLGANLTSLGIPALDSDITGRPRPVVGAWDAGAYEFAVLARPNPPTNLTATAR